MKKNRFPEIKSEIKQRELESKAMRKRASTLAGMERHAVQMEQRHFGYSTRVLLLIYAMLRGRAYLATEPCTKNLMYVHDMGWSIEQAAKRLGVEITRDQYRAWLTGTRFELPTKQAEVA